MPGRSIHSCGETSCDFDTHFVSRLLPRCTDGEAALELIHRTTASAVNCPDKNSFPIRTTGPMIERAPLPYSSSPKLPTSFSPSIHVSPSCLITVLGVMPASSARAAASGSEWVTTQTCVRSAARAIRRASGAIRSGWRLVSGSFSAMKDGRR